MKTQATIRNPRTFYVSYTLYEPHDVGQHGNVRAFCKKRFEAKYLQDTYFVCTTFLPASQIAKELYQAMADETGQEGQVVVIDGTQGRSADAVRLLATVPDASAASGEAVKTP